jgi:hypothetical protein
VVTASLASLSSDQAQDKPLSFPLNSNNKLWSLREVPALCHRKQVAEDSNNDLLPRQLSLVALPSPVLVVAPVSFSARRLRPPGAPQ